jgi:hypothetical protein
VAGPCEHDNELPGPIKGGGFPDQLYDYQLLRKASASRH